MNQQRKIMLTLIFAKKGLMRYISHLDLMRLFSRALRRAELPVKFSEGFNRKYKISIKNALKLGIESESEQVSFRLTEEVDPQWFCDCLQKQMPEGIIFRPKTQDG